jgi:hypothetical protein
MWSSEIRAQFSGPEMFLFAYENAHKSIDDDVVPESTPIDHVGICSCLLNPGF